MSLSAPKKILVILTCFVVASYLFLSSRNSPTPDTLSASVSVTPPVVIPTLPSSIEGPYLVTKVVDGDTIEINKDNQNTKIRLVGIDTPETVDPRKPVQCFGIEASNKTKQLLQGQSVYLEIDNPTNLVDKYDRLLRYVYRASDNLFINQYLVQNGYAHEYTYQGKPHRYQLEFRALESTARDQKLGLWDTSVCP